LRRSPSHACFKGEVLDTMLYTALTRYFGRRRRSACLVTPSPDVTVLMGSCRRGCYTDMGVTEQRLVGESSG